jgi:hypothetical protein
MYHLQAQFGSLVTLTNRSAPTVAHYCVKSVGSLELQEPQHNQSPVTVRDEYLDALV